MIGQQVGKLTIISQLPKYQKKERTKYKCQCLCGNIAIVFGYNLKNNHTTSCGCVRKHKAAEYHKIEVGKAAKNLLYKRYKDRANLKRISFTVPFDFFINLTSKNCHYCNAEPSLIVLAKGNNGSYIYNGLDRVDSNAGYNIDNIVSCCFTCNRAKGTLTHDQFMSWLKRIYINLLGDIHA